MDAIALDFLFDTASQLLAAPSSVAERLEVRGFLFQGVVNPWRANELAWSWRGAIITDETLLRDAEAQPVDRASEPGPGGLSRAIEQRSSGQCEAGAVRVVSWNGATSEAIILALFRPR